MTRIICTLLALALPSMASTETLVAARTIATRSIIAPEDLTVAKTAVPGALVDANQAIGMEARVVLYPGRPIRPGDLIEPALIDRNDIIVLVYRRSGLTIATEGRALDRGAAGDRVRAMNLASRTTVSGTVGEDGTVRVGPSEALLAQIGDGS